MNLGRGETVQSNGNGLFIFSGRYSLPWKPMGQFSSVEIEYLLFPFLYDSPYNLLQLGNKSRLLLDSNDILVVSELCISFLSVV